MKNLSILFSLLLAMSGCNGSAQNKLKRYDLKSGIVEYVTTTSGKVMGSTINGSGTETLYFKDWGALELKESVLSQTTIMKFLGNSSTETEETHTIVKLDNGDSYSVDFNKKQIYVSRDISMDMIMANQPNGDAGEVGESMLVSMGGEKTGTEKFLGYTCDVWEIMGGKQWIHKGLMLKMEMTVLGITTKTEATSVKLDVSVPNANFELPDFPIQEIENFMGDEDLEYDAEEMEEGMEMMQHLSFEEWKQAVIEGDPEMKDASEEELRHSYDMMQKVLKLRSGN
ncbi:MAG: hypothetical protein KUL83_11665 [Lentimicrobium sp.]|jgi:hypothetical protein|nr:hypothetical protein [Lentimicrobium sp.]MDD2527980.1 hypothetical protein [Lentimicrobiaceae bacterium]MDD4597200.1 hypothetical protein [Lentimicrobiaceae bacterium]MDY0025663.1 hypothetical protein [Lentimicrobium sp.]